MRLAITHRVETDLPSAGHAIFYLRATPLSHQHQLVESWRVSASRPAAPWQDAYGNVVHTVVGPDDRSAVLRLTATGIVQIDAAETVVRPNGERLPPGYWLRPTALTALGAEARAALEAIGGLAPDADIATLDALSAAIGERLDPEADPLSAGHGFIAACRACGLPARQVIGYRLADGRAGANGPGLHGWAEAFMPGVGWAGFDPSRRCRPVGGYVRVAVGLDGGDCAPVKGGRGGDADRITVTVETLED